MSPAVERALKWFSAQTGPVALFSTVTPGVPSSSMRRKLQDRGLIEVAPGQKPVGLIALQISDVGRQALANGDEPPPRLALSGLTRRLCARVGVKLNGQDMGQTVRAYDAHEGWVKLVDGRTGHGKVEPYWRTGP